jgi:hypothetical protein
MAGCSLANPPPWQRWSVSLNSSTSIKIISAHGTCLADDSGSLTPESCGSATASRQNWNLTYRADGRIEIRNAGTFFIPSEQWSQPEQIWVWLPPADRPAPLDRFGPGTRLGAHVSTLDEALPDLRQRVRDIEAENWREAGLDDDDPVPDRFVEQVWPAAVAYAISFVAQAGERPAHRPPLQHLTGSFDSLRDHLRLIGSRLDFDDIESTLSVGVEVIIEALWPHTAQALL